MALGSTKSLTQMKRVGVGGLSRPSAYGWQAYHLYVPSVLKYGSLNFLELTGPVQGLLYVFVFMNNVKYLWHIQITNITFQFSVELRLTALLFEMGMVRCNLQILRTIKR